MAEVDYPAILEEAWALHLAPREPGALTVISLFAGCGGSSLGYSIAGYRELLASDWDERCAKTFRLNFPGVPFLVADVRELSAEGLMEAAGLFGPGELDVLDGSPPCQGFSTAGKRDLWDPRNELYREFARLLEGVSPKAFVMENVSGMVKGKMKLAFADCMRALKAAGYRVSCRLLDAKWFLVPQSRKRLIWIGIRKDLQNKVSYPEAEKTSKLITSGAALVDLYDDVSERAMLEPRHKTYQQMKIVKAGDRCRLHHSHHRLHHNRVAPTIDRGGGAGAYHVWHFTEHRPITTLELRRLFSFPDQFERVNSVNDFFEQLGNSVPPLFMKAIAQHIREEILNKT